MRRALPLAVPLAALAGGAAAVLQLAGALKTAPLPLALPLDLTLAALLALAALLPLLAATHRWRIGRGVALPAAAAALLWLWAVVAGSWTASRLVVADKLVDMVLVAPAMLAAGLLVGAAPAARAALAAGCLLAGVALAALLGWGVLSGQPLAAPAAGAANYQVIGLAMAIAATLAALRAVEAPHPLLALPWLALAAGLGFAALLPGGRTALLALGLGVALAPALRLWLAGRRGAGLGWAAAALLGGLGLLSDLLLNPVAAEGLRTLERLGGGAAGLEARAGLWSAALEFGGRAAPLGLGTGGFGIAEGHGDSRALHPHNHALEALSEFGLPGLLLWLGAFGGALALAAARLGRVDPGRAACIAALVLPVAISVMVSSDQGNRMAWFALGLTLSLGVAARPLAGRRHAGAGPPPAPLPPGLARHV